MIIVAGRVCIEFAAEIDGPGPSLRYTPVTRRRAAAAENVHKTSKRCIKGVEIYTPVNIPALQRPLAVRVLSASRAA